MRFFLMATLYPIGGACVNHLIAQVKKRFYPLVRVRSNASTGELAEQPFQRHGQAAKDRRIAAQNP